MAIIVIATTILTVLGCGIVHLDLIHDLDTVAGGMRAPCYFFNTIITSADKNA